MTSKSMRCMEVAVFWALISAGCEQKWTPVPNASGLDLYVDKSSIQKADHVVTATVKLQSSGLTTYIVATHRINCANRTYLPTQRLFYDMDGILIGEGNKGLPASFMPITHARDEGMEALFDYLCH